MHMLGPFPEISQLLLLYISRFGVICKATTLGSSGSSLTCLSYQIVVSMMALTLTSAYYGTTVNEVAAQVAALGRGALLAKVDTEATYRLLPVHPQYCVSPGHTVT